MAEENETSRLGSWREVFDFGHVNLRRSLDNKVEILNR